MVRPCYVAASSNNLTVLTLLLAAPGATAWVRDLQGRTPLHCAAEAVKSDNIEVCKALRQKMVEERPGHDPVGQTAPVDWLGTPLGRQIVLVRKWLLCPLKVYWRYFIAMATGVSCNSPVNVRSGHSPWKASPVPVIKPACGENISYAFSEASGWRHYMEDRVLAIPLS